MAVRGQRRMAELVRARHITMWLLKTELNMSYVEIGKWFGTKDHTTAMHGVKKINEQLSRGEEELQGEIDNLKIKLLT
jgi:chromosomal replication initiator protein